MFGQTKKQLNISEAQKSTQANGSSNSLTSTSSKRSNVGDREALILQNYPCDRIYNRHNGVNPTENLGNEVMSGELMLAVFNKSFCPPIIGKPIARPPKPQRSQIQCLPHSGDQVVERPECYSDINSCESFELLPLKVNYKKKSVGAKFDREPF